MTNPFRAAAAAAPAAAPAPAVAAPAAAAAPAPSALTLYSGAAATFNEVQNLTTNGNRVTAAALQLAPATHRRVTVLINIPRSWIRNPLRIGHVGLVFWRALANPPFHSIGIVDDGSTADEGVTTAELRHSDTLDLWYFTTATTLPATTAMLNRIAALDGTMTYGEFIGNRLRGTYNCVTYVDNVLSYGGLSTGAASPAAWFTPWTYSLTFKNWQGSVRRNTTNL